MKRINIFSVKHIGLKDCVLVRADNIKSAIDKFNNYYEDDYDITTDGIESVELAFSEDIIE